MTIGDKLYHDFGDEDGERGFVERDQQAAVCLHDRERRLEAKNGGVEEDHDKNKSLNPVDSTKPCARSVTVFRETFSDIKSPSAGSG